MAAYVGENPDLRLADLAYSLAITDSGRAYRAVLLARERAELRHGLRELAAGNDVPGLFLGAGDGGKLGFLFSGQGGQRTGMGRELYEIFPVFAAALDEVCAGLDPYLGHPLRDVIFAADADGEADRLNQTMFTQASIFALEAALFRLLRSWGVEPDHVLGHSLGELAAAHVAGVLPLPAACRLVAVRGRLMQEITGNGAMAVIQAGEHEVAPDLEARSSQLSLAAVNGPSSVVVAGDEEAVLEVAARWREKGRITQRVNVKVAGHSPHMDQLLEPLRETVEGLELRSAAISVAANVTGTMDTAGDLSSSDYWVRQVRRPVRFNDGIRSLHAAGVSVFLELGPDGGLTGMGRTCLADTDAVLIPVLRGSRYEARAVVLALAQLQACGVPVDWKQIFAGSGARVIDVPALEPAPSQARAVPLSERLRALPHHEQSRLLMDLVRTQVAFVADHLTMDDVAEERPFADLGLSSLNAVELRDRMSSALGTKLPVTLMYDHPTPAALVRYVRGRLLGDVGRPVAAGAAVADDPIAIVAMSCRYPGGVQSPEDLWHLVSSGGDAITPFPADRGWDTELLSPFTQGRKGSGYRSEGGFLHDAGEFDASLFRLSQREALAMDPQQRLALESAWEAIERAGIDPLSLKSSDTGVFVGTNGQDYASLLPGSQERLEVYQGTGGAASVLSGRIAYVFGLEGPAISVDTACSSSLVALHLAGQALRYGDCSLALVCGVTVMATPRKFLEFARNRGLSPDGRCMSFADTANGIALSEGVGTLLIERLSDARRNGHRVLALVRGTAVNQDGASNGLTAPNGPSQERVIRRALENARLSPQDVDVVEAHGTGTRLGDPIEAQALLATYGQDRPDARPLWLGSLKSNIGHTQAASGIGGIIKMVMAMHHGVLPRTLHVSEPSRHVDWSAGHVRLLTETVAWPGRDVPRRAGVSAFGISGTNAHVILEESPETLALPEVEGTAEPKVVPLMFSGRTQAALNAQAARLRSVLDRPAAPSIVDIAHSLAVTRAPLEHSAVIVAEPGQHLADALNAAAEGRQAAGLVRREPRKNLRTALLFQGHGAQDPNLGRALAAAFPTFADHLAAVSAQLNARNPEASLFAMETAMFRCLETWGVRPDFVVGHRISGELVAAHISGVIDLADAATLLRARSTAPSDHQSFQEETRTVTYHPARLPIFTTAGGDFAGPPSFATPSYWHPGRAEPPARDLADAPQQGTTCFIGLGLPENNLPWNTVTDLCPPHEEPARGLVTALAGLYGVGVPVDWRAFVAEYGGRRIDLPTYPFQRRHYWLKPHGDQLPRADAG